MSKTPYPPITLDLSRLDGEDTMEHLGRIAAMHKLPGQGPAAATQHPASVHTGVDKLKPGELAELEAATVVKREAALKTLRPKRGR